VDYEDTGTTSKGNRKAPSSKDLSVAGLKKTGLNLETRQFLWEL